MLLQSTTITTKHSRVKEEAGISIHSIHSAKVPEAVKDGFSLLILCEGAGSIHVREEQHMYEGAYVFPLNEGSCYTLQPGSFKKGYMVELSRDFIQCNNLAIELLPFSRCNGFSLQPPAADEISYLIRKICLLQELTDGNDQSITATLIKLLLLYLHKSMPETNRSVTMKRQHAIAELFFSLVGKHFRDKKMVTDYASELCVSPHYLTQVVKEVTGETASYFIQQQIAKEAKKQARLSSKSMKEVAFELGFEDQAHFSKFFKKNTGMNFTTFRSNGYAK
jgi:AraC family transcriptional regulator, transcriptional activator of pobA